MGLGSGLKTTYDHGFGVVALGVWFLEFGFRDQVGCGAISVHCLPQPASCSSDANARIFDQLGYC